MDKVSQLKTIAKGLAAGGVLGTSGGILASSQIASNKRSARSKKGWDTRRRLTKAAQVAPLVPKLRASGLGPAQSITAKPKKPRMTTKHSLTTADTIKGSSRAYVSRNSMPVSFEPEHAPRSKSLSELRGGIKRV